MRHTPTRRELVGSGIATGAAAWILAAGDAAAATETDAQVLTEPLQVEQLLIVAYGRAVAAPGLAAAERSEVRRLLAQELEHAKALELAVARLGGTASSTLPSLAVAQSELTRYEVPWSLTRLRTRRAALKLLIDLESVAESAYFKAIGNLHDAAAVRTCAEIMGCEAQHWTVLSAILNHGDVTRAVPYPFVGGPG